MNNSEFTQPTWIVGQPGGPSGPFYSVVSSTGRIIAMQVPDGDIAAKIARIPVNEEQDRRLVADLETIRNAILLVSPDLLMDTVSTLNFWISVYSRDNDAL